MEDYNPIKIHTSVNYENIQNAAANWACAVPFPHFVVDNFFDEEFAKLLEDEFPDFGDSVWHSYNNAIEVKKVCNNWNAFPETTYRALSFLNSSQFVDFVSGLLFANTKLHSDPGLNGGGWHIHRRGGKLNTHLDYSIHPKMGLRRKLNIIIYLNSKWQDEWGGQLGLWGNENDNFPGDLKKSIIPKFNRAVVFDTTKNSWHGLPEPLTCPEGEYRKSIAVYYLDQPEAETDTRGKALFSPYGSQVNDPSVLELIRARSNTKTAGATYRIDD